MTTPHEFLCGPTRPGDDPEDTTTLGRVPTDDLTLEDRAAIANFRGFLAGDLYVCPVCMDPDDTCRPDARCCPGCPGTHITARPGTRVAKRTMDGQS